MALNSNLANLADFIDFMPILMNYASGGFHCKGFLCVCVASPGSILPHSQLLFGCLMHIQQQNQLKHRTKREHANLTCGPPPQLKVR